MQLTTGTELVVIPVELMHGWVGAQAARLPGRRRLAGERRGGQAARDPAGKLPALHAVPTIMRKPVAFVGHSGSGKTTLVCRLVAHLVSAGRSVAVIKHTHHELSEMNRGDTERFLAAGAAEAVLAENSRRSRGRRPAGDLGESRRGRQLVPERVRSAAVCTG